MKNKSISIREKDGPVRAIANLFTRISEKYLPDAFVFLFFLSLVVLGLGIYWEPNHSVRTVIDYWNAGFFSIMSFTYQIILVMVTGFSLAHTPFVKKAIVSFTRIPKTEAQVIVTTTLVAMLGSWISWGFGLVVGGIVAREMGIAHRGKVHYPLIVAAAYAGFIVWHAGYGGSIPTVIASPDHFLISEIGVVPVTETIFSPFNLILLLAVVIVVPFSLVMMRPKPEEKRVGLPESEIAEGDDTHEEPVKKQDMTPAEKLEKSRYIPLILGAMAMASLVSYFVAGGAVNINSVIMSFFAFGLLLAPSIREYIHYCVKGAAASSGIIIQFPFYAAMMGVIASTGMAADLGGALVSIATKDTLPFLSFISAGIINFFIPAGGGQWVMQGPIVVEAANQLNASIPRVAMAVAWGDAWTNMVQPFWALPLLAIAGLNIRSIMGYTALVLVVSGVVISLGVLIL